ncbi:hypothetical protein IQ07DRAFT_242441 [Pyrenochaeta sp. DS3sAY3a]|nr:hypothetical protein IQ07DRAFT_242441 [Pyrenochaeta sp. DS3sAY3a]
MKLLLCLQVQHPALIYSEIRMMTNKAPICNNLEISRTKTWSRAKRRSTQNDGNGGMNDFDTLGLASSSREAPGSTLGEFGDAEFSHLRISPRPRANSVAPSDGTASEPSKCTHCGKVYLGIYSRGNLAWHIRQEHSHRRVYKCEYTGCNHGFARKDARSEHYRKYHLRLRLGNTNTEEYPHPSNELQPLSNELQPLSNESQPLSTELQPSENADGQVSPHSHETAPTSNEPLIDPNEMEISPDTVTATKSPPAQ